MDFNINISDKNYCNYDLKKKNYNDIKIKNTELLFNQEKVKKEIELLQQQFDSDKLKIDENNKKIKLMDLEFKSKLDELKLKKSVCLENHKISLEKNNTLVKKLQTERAKLKFNREKYQRILSESLQLPNIYRVNECVYRTCQMNQEIDHVWEKHRNEFDEIQKKCYEEREAAKSELNKINQKIKESTMNNQLDASQRTKESYNNEINNLQIEINSKQDILENLKETEKCNNGMYTKELTIFRAEIKNITKLNEKLQQIYDDKMITKNNLINKTTNQKQ